MRTYIKVSFSLVSLFFSEAKADTLSQLPELCDHEGKSMFACARENSLAMQEYMQELIAFIVRSLPSKEAEIFKRDQEEWNKINWKLCIDKYDVNYPEGKYGANVCITEVYVERARDLRAMYWKKNGL